MSRKLHIEVFLGKEIGAGQTLLPVVVERVRGPPHIALSSSLLDLV